jgi:hypothetical protein
VEPFAIPVEQRSVVDGHRQPRWCITATGSLDS